ncbi:MAG: transposase, partial [Acidiferrobacterales bacterium]
MRDRNAEFVLQQQVRGIRRRAKQADSMDFFNLITGPELLERLEALLPEYRERRFPPTVTLAMFLGQVLRADSSCQNAVNEAIVNQLLSGVAAVSANTGGYCQARDRLPLDLVRELGRQTGIMMNEHTPQGWLWRGRHVKLTDGTTTLMPDTGPNQARYPQHGSQEQGAGFPIARLVA